MHRDLVPPEDLKDGDFDRDQPDWITEFDVITNLKKMSHEVLTLGVDSDLKIIRNSIEQFNPHMVFNLLEEFDGEAIFDQNVVSYLELLRIPYTGCNPRGLILARDKALTKKVLAFHRIKTPKFCVYPKNKLKKRPKHLEFPLIVKCLYEDASYGIAQASVVRSDEKLAERVNYINQKLGVDAIAEEFIEGREFYVGILGNYRHTVLPTWELVMENVENPEKELYSGRAKWNNKYRQRKGIKSRRATLDNELEKQVQTIAKKAYKALGLNGYARIDFRISLDGEVYVLEVNPNPDISSTEDFACSAKAAKLNYRKLLHKILTLGLSWHQVRPS
jgi:D-alanine-D-alanine ligase